MSPTAIYQWSRSNVAWDLGTWVLRTNSARVGHLYSQRHLTKRFVDCNTCTRRSQTSRFLTQKRRKPDFSKVFGRTNKITNNGVSDTTEIHFGCLQENTRLKRSLACQRLLILKSYKFTNENRRRSPTSNHLATNKFLFFRSLNNYLSQFFFTGGAELTLKSLKLQRSVWSQRFLSAFLQILVSCISVRGWTLAHRFPLLFFKCLRNSIACCCRYHLHVTSLAIEFFASSLSMDL